jgi:D-alanine-D-alanine ligase
MAGANRIGVLLGGLSPERDLSVRAGEAVLSTLRELGHDATPIFVDRDIDLALRQARVEIAFLALRGRYAGDGCLQGLLELLGIPYTGSGVLASGLAMNRAKTKEVLRLHNLPTAPAYVLHAEPGRPPTEGHGAFGFPVMVRPVGAPTPVGCGLARDELELEAAVDEALRLDEDVLVERFVEGRSLYVGVLDGVAMGAIELGARANAGVPPRISPARYRSILRIGAAAYEALGCEGAACVELVVNDRLNEVVVQVDTHPLLSPLAPLARVARLAGMKYGDLIEEILRGARVRAHGHRHNRRAEQIEFDGPDRRASAAGAAH